ncbi:MAG: zinc-binding dehydrogenase [Candidatus Bathyarchaeia archaeon]
MVKLRKTHKAAVLREFGKNLSIEEVPTQLPTNAGVLVKTAGAGLCHTDIPMWKGEWSQMGMPPKTPFILSHEATGVVVARGQDVPDEWKEGDKALVYPFQWEGEDEYVIRGLTNLANKGVHMGIVKDGGLQEYLYVPHYKFLVKAEGIEDLAAASPLGCAGTTSYRAVKTALGYVEPGDYVAVVGLGGLGSYAVQWVKGLMPYVNLVGIDVRDEAIEFASKLVKMDLAVNASKTDIGKALSEVTKGKGTKVVIDFVGTHRTVGTYINMLAKRGAYILVGLMGTEAVAIHMAPHVMSERTLKGSFTGTLAEANEVIELARKGIINYRGVVTRRYTLDEVNEALKELAEGKILGREIIVFK